MFVFIAAILSSSAFADGSTVTACCASAESENSGLSVDVKLGSSTQLSSSDLDAVFDKIAELHTDATLNLSYNGAGQAALAAALDCISDAGMATVSGFWANEHDSNISARTYTARYYTIAGPVDTLYFSTVYDYNGGSFVELAGTTGVMDCAVGELTALGSHDAWVNTGSSWARCMKNECEGQCSYVPSEAHCDCDEPQSCSTVFSSGSGSGSNMVSFSYSD